MHITFVFPADLYSFQGLAGRVRPAVGVFIRGHDPFRKPVATFRDHALLSGGMILSENRQPLFGITPYE
jgi:hypothetical protein